MDGGNVARKISDIELYKLLIGTHRSCNGYKQYAKKIAEMYNVSTAYISKRITKLKQEGYIIPGKRTSEIYYYPTKRKLTRELTNSTMHQGAGVFGCSKSQWSCPIDKMPPESQLNKFWIKRAMANGVVQYLLEYPFLKPVNAIL